MSNKDSRMWGGRFDEPTDAFVQAFTASVNFDQRLAMVDIQGSLAHAKMLQKIGVLSANEHAQIEQGMAQIKQEITDRQFDWSVSLEDVHMNIESRLTQLIGDAGKAWTKASRPDLKASTKQPHW